MLEVRKLETSYGRSQVLFGVDLKIEQSEVVSLLGRNGMGKTTTVRSIMGITPPRAGTVSFQSKPIQKLPSYRIAQAGLGLVPEGRMFFANAERIRQKMQPLIEQAKPKVVVLHLSGVFDLEYTALKMLIEAEKRLREVGVTVWLAGLTPGVFATVMKSQLGKTLGTERMFFNLEQAVARYANPTVPP